MNIPPPIITCVLLHAYHSSRSSRLRSLVAESSTKTIAGDDNDLLEKLGSGSDVGDGEIANPAPAYTSATLSRSSLGIMSGSGPNLDPNTAGSHLPAANAKPSTTPLFFFASPPAVLAGFGEPSRRIGAGFDKGRGLDFRRGKSVGEGRLRQSCGRRTSVPIDLFKD